MKDYKEQMTDPRWAARSREIMKRDNFTCQLCGRSDRGLNVHHIKYQNDLDYWDYPDELLLTVCPVCHAKIHGKPVPAEKKPKITSVGIKEEELPIKSVFYKSLFWNNELTANDKIIYSFIVYKSYYDNKTQDKNGYVLMREISYSYIQKCFGICKSCTVASMKKLKSFGFVKDDKVKISGLVESGYFKLYDTNPRIKGELMIFYSYIKHKSDYFGGYIDSFKYRIAEEMCITKIAVTKLLNRLYKLKLAKRMPNGKLKIN